MGIRKLLKTTKEEYLLATKEGKRDAYEFTSVIIILVFFCFGYMTARWLYWKFDKSTGISICVFTSILLIVEAFTVKLSGAILPISARIIEHFFGKYGKVVRKNDWKQMKKNYPTVYKYIWDKENSDYCYKTSWALASCLKDAKLMYCVVPCKQGGRTGHSVVVKNNCVYDTNNRTHYSYEEYVKTHNTEVFRVFTKKEYSQKTFFEDVQKDFLKWCLERKAYFGEF